MRQDNQVLNSDQITADDETNIKIILQNKLKASYTTNSKIERLFYPNHPLKLKDCYLDLALLKPDQDKQEEIEPEKVISRSHILRAYERIEISKEKLDVHEILDKCKEKARRRIYIEGAAGAGKSTLCQFIALNWAKDKAPWNTYQWVFHLRLRDLSNYLNEKKKPDKLLVKVLMEKCLQLGFDALDSKSTKKLLTEILRNKENHSILFILDGLDEVKTEGNAKLPPVLQKLVNSNYDLLITSRPGIVILKRAFNINMDLAVIGFSDSQVKKYINNFFAFPLVDKKIADDCLSLIEKESSLWSLAHTPIQLELLCSIWGQELVDLKSLTFTKLYQLIYEKIFKRWIEKQDKPVEDHDRCTIEADNQTYIDYMKYLAFIGMRDKVIVLDKDHKEKAYKKIKAPKDLYAQLKAMGLIKQSDDKLEFIHLTFQEHLAANYLAECIEEIAVVTPTNTLSKSLQMDIKELFQFIADTKFDPFYEVMWWFVAGTLAAKDRAKKTNKLTQLFFDLLLQEPRLKTEIEELALIIRCLNEAYDVKLEQKEAIIKHVNIWYAFCLKDKYRYYLEKNPLVSRFDEAIAGSASIIPFVEDAILRLLGSGDSYVQSRVIQAIGALGGHATPEMKAELLRFLGSEDSDVQCSVIEAIKALGAHATLELQMGLLRLLGSENSYVQWRVIEAIGALGAHATPEMKAELLRSLGSEDSNVQWCVIVAIRALGAHATPEMKAELLRSLGSEDSNVQWCVIGAIGALGAHATPEMKAELLWFLSSEDSDVQRRVIEAIRAFGAHATPEMKTELLRLLGSEDRNVQRRVIEAIVALGAHATPEMKMGLLRFLENRNSNVQWCVIEAIRELGAHATPEVKTELLRLLESRNSDVQSHAVQMIQEHFNTDQLIIDGLLKLVKYNKIDRNILSLISSLPGTLHCYCEITFENTLGEKMPKRIQPSKLLNEIIEKYNEALNINSLAISGNNPIFPNVNTVKIKKVKQTLKNVNSNSLNKTQGENNMQRQPDISSSSSSSSAIAASNDNQKEWPFNSITDYLALLHTDKFDLTQTERAMLTNFQLDLIDLFKKNSSPSELWVAEYICLAIGANKAKYTQLLNDYLKFVEETPILESYHLQGLATLINLANVDDAWLTPSHASQLFAILKKKGGLLSDLTNKSDSEVYQLLGLWQSLITALCAAGCEIDEQDKKWIKGTLSEVKKHFHGEEKEVVEWLVKLTEQNLLRTKDNRLPLWKRSGAHLLSAGVAACQATAALGTGAATFGVTSVAAIEPGVKMVFELGKAAHEVIRDIRENHKKKDWFHDLEDLQSLIIAAVVNKDEKEFDAIINQLCAVSDKKLNLIFAHGLLDTWISLLIGYQETSHAFLQEGCGKLFAHYLNTLDNRSYEARLFAKTAEILSKYKVNPSIPLMWIDFIAKKNQAYAEMPLVSGVLEGMRQLYKFIDNLKINHKSETREYIEFTNVQKRLLVKCETSQNDLVAEMLVNLIQDKNVKDKSAAEAVLRLFSQSVKAESEKRQRSKNVHTEEATIPMIGVLWVTLNDKQQQTILGLCQRQGLIQPVNQSPKQGSGKKQLALVGSADNMIVSLALASGAFHFDFETEEQGKGWAASGLNEVFKEKLIDSKKHERDLTKEAGQKEDLMLANKVGFIYIGEFVQGGAVLAGSGQKVIASAERLAEKYLSQKPIRVVGDHIEQDAQEKNKQSPSASGLSTHGLYGTHGSQSSSSSSSSSNSASSNDLPKMNIAIKTDDDGDYYEITIDYSKLSPEKANSYQVILKEQALKSASYIAEKTTNYRNKCIKTLCFENKEAAEDLINAIKLYSAANQNVVELSNEGKSSLGKS